MVGNPDGLIQVRLVTARVQMGVQLQYNVPWIMQGRIYGDLRLAPLEVKKNFVLMFNVKKLC